MTAICLTEAKTHLPELLERAAKGESFLITRHGQPVALLTPPPPSEEKQIVKEVITQMKALRRGNTLGGISLRALIEEGRRF